MNVPEAGAVLGDKYRIVAKLGEGGMGVVYRAQNLLTGRHVALKWLHPHRGASSDGPLRLIREAQATARFRHPNVVDVYDVVQDGITLFMVMELLEGESFRAYLNRQQNHSIPALLDLLLPTLDGVAAAHENGIVHRDLKPDNIFIVSSARTRELTAKVVDFGIAKIVSAQTPTLTDTGAAIGSPLYMPLEQLRGDKDIDSRADVYAFGAMLYEAICGRVPYTADSLPGLALKVLTTDPIPLERLRGDVPIELARVVSRALAKEREQRTPDVVTLIRELTPFSGGATAAPSGPPPRTRGIFHPRLAGRLGVVVWLGLVALAALGLTWGRSVWTSDTKREPNTLEPSATAAPEHSARAADAIAAGAASVSEHATAPMTAPSALGSAMPAGGSDAPARAPASRRARAASKSARVSSTGATAPPQPAPTLQPAPQRRYERMTDLPYERMADPPYERMK